MTQFSPQYPNLGNFLIAVVLLYWDCINIVNWSINHIAVYSLQEDQTQVSLSVFMTHYDLSSCQNQETQRVFEREDKSKPDNLLTYYFSGFKFYLFTMICSLYLGLAASHILFCDSVLSCYLLRVLQRMIVKLDPWK